MSAELKLLINIAPSIKPLKSIIACTTSLSFCAVPEKIKSLYTAAHTSKTTTASSSPGFTYYIKITLN